jgi:hypothetical protein
MFRDLCSMHHDDLNFPWREKILMSRKNTHLTKIRCNKKFWKYESVTFKMTHFAFVNKGQNHYDYKWNLTLIDKRKLCHGLIYFLIFIIYFPNWSINWINKNFSNVYLNFIHFSKKARKIKWIGKHTNFLHPKN